MEWSSFKEYDFQVEMKLKLKGIMHHTIFKIIN